MELNAIKEVILDQRVQLDSISKREKIIKRESNQFLLMMQIGRYSVQEEDTVQCGYFKI